MVPEAYFREHTIDLEIYREARSALIKMTEARFHKISLDGRSIEIGFWPGNNSDHVKILHNVMREYDK